MPAKKPKRVVSRGGLPPNKYLSVEQIKQIREHFSVRRAPFIRCGYLPFRMAINEMLVDVLLNTGLRVGELCDLQLRDLPSYHKKLVVNVQRGKGSVQRTVVISDALAKRLVEYVQQYRKGGKPKSYLFTNERNTGPISPASLRNKFRILGPIIGIEPLNPHRFRHTFATELYKQCQDLLFVRDQLGHTDPQTTAIYAKTASEKRQKVMNGFDL